MGKSTPKPPPTPSPQSVINADAQANRVGQINPFGSATYQTGQNGTNVVTQLSPQMQGLVDRQFGLANTDSQRLSMPAGMEQIGAGLINRVGQRYGAGGGGKPGMSQPMPPPGGAVPTGGNASDTLAALQAALARRGG